MKNRLELLVAEMVDRGIMFEHAVEEFEKHFILAVLKRTNGNLCKAAEELHIHRNTLSKRVEKYYQNGHMTGARRRRPRNARASKAPHPGGAAKSLARVKR
jgi:Fis family transcriptional regulator